MSTIARSTLLCLILAPTAIAQTVLTFDLGTTATIVIPSDYGDRVTAATMGSYSYGGSAPFTPNVKVGYRGTPLNPLYHWSTGYNQLTSVAYHATDGQDNYEISFAADSGFQVELSGFDLGNWGAAITLPAVRVFDEGGQTVFEQLSIPLEVNSGTHTSFAFSPALEGRVLRIVIELTGLGGNSDNVGIDNIAFAQSVTSPSLGSSYCGPAVPNSTGAAGVLNAYGSDVASDDDFVIVANCLPELQFGYFLAGQTQGFFSPPASSGNICLSGNIARFNGGTEIIVGPVGTLVVPLTGIPVNPTQPVLSGETWNFQCWYRDAGTNNFTDGLAVMFQ